YDNSENIVYKINYKIEDHLIDKAIQNYINNCIVQEYTFGNIKNTNRLILNRKTEIDFLRKVQIFIKNNIGLRKLKR
ncbi:MAG: hypothetical protein Q8880_13430, partial [Bacteroidota bacterium]|nr:hypothetical protein [Bacteroidota bacterium]